MALTYQQDRQAFPERPPERLLKRETRRICERWSPLQSTLFVIATSSALWLAVGLSLVFAL